MAAPGLGPKQRGDSRAELTKTKEIGKAPLKEPTLPVHTVNVCVYCMFFFEQNDV